METLITAKTTIVNICKVCFNPKYKLSPAEKLKLLKADLIALYLVAIRLYYVIYN